MYDQSRADQFILFATGSTPNKAYDELEGVWKVNLADALKKVPHFYMQTGICYEKMSLGNRLLMKMVSGKLEKEKNLNNPSDEPIPSLKKSYDISSFTYAELLIQYLKEL